VAKKQAKPVKKAVAKAAPARKAVHKPASKSAAAAKPAAKATSAAKTKLDPKALKAAAAPVKANGKGAPALQPMAKANVKLPVKAGAKAGKPGEETPGDADSPLLDMSDAQVRKMIAKAKTRGYVTYDELNKVLPSDKVSSEQIEDTMSLLNEMGINVIESEEQEEGAEGENLPATTEGKEVVATTGKAAEAYDRTDDPVRMYLREMGSVELLSREGEIAIAKRIEAGRELMIGALCESPLTFEALTVWRDELNEGKVLLRDIIDLEAMYAVGPEGQAAAALRDANNPNAQAIAAANASGGPIVLPKALPPAPPSPFRRRLPSRRSPKAKKARKPPRPPTARRMTTASTTRATFRSARWKPRSSRRCSNPSTPSRISTRSSASSRTRRSKPRSAPTSCPPARNAASRSCATRPWISSRG